MSDDERHEFMEKMEAARRAIGKVERDAEEILLPPQLDRLREIAIQMVGMGALSTDFVSKELNITDEQKKS
ncbi:MAG: hypothetical protein R3C05_16300 [Pirellulaceae bacterium]